LASKNVAQFFLIAATAPEPLVGSPPAAGAEDWEADDPPVVAGVVLPELPPLLEHAVSASPVAASTLTTRRDDSRNCRRCMATVCRTNVGGVNHDVGDSPEFFRGSGKPFHGS
jgi:hypothetical protein